MSALDLIQRIQRIQRGLTGGIRFVECDKSGKRVVVHPAGDGTLTLNISGACISGITPEQARAIAMMFVMAAGEAEGK